MSKNRYKNCKIKMKTGKNTNSVSKTYRKLGARRNGKILGDTKRSPSRWQTMKRFAVRKSSDRCNSNWTPSLS